MNRSTGSIRSFIATLTLAPLSSFLLVGATPVAAAASPGEPIPGFQGHCEYTYSAKVDPIASPGGPSAHLHDFFGTRPDENSTYKSLRAGGSDCVVAEDTAGYWIPSLYTPDAQAKPVQRAPVSAAIYYTEPGPEAGGPRIHTPPPNLKMIAGDPDADGPQDLSIAWYDCAAPIGEYSPRAAAPYLCGVGQFVRSHVLFPSCWDGVPPARVGDDSEHMSYPVHESCPGGTVYLPEVHLSVVYGIRDGRGATLASGGGKNDPASIYTLHADFFNAWDPVVLTQLVAGCLNDDREIACGIPTTPGINNLTPASGGPGTAVNITGKVFGEVHSVRFNGKAADFDQLSQTRVIVTVPPGASTGKVSMTTDGDTGAPQVNTTGYSSIDFVVP